MHATRETARIDLLLTRAGAAETFTHQMLPYVHCLHTHQHGMVATAEHGAGTQMDAKETG
eukprot:127991-Amphidinium_carterae.1